MKAYLTVKEKQVCETVIKRSRFIATIANINDSSDAAEFINSIKSKYSDATHNCYAYIIDDTDMKCSDDSEPQGTAGAPILEVLKKNTLQRTVIVVTRYFGGVKLGSSGLIGAYSASAVKAVELSEKVNMAYSDYLAIVSDYSIIGKIDTIIEKNGGYVLGREYMKDVKTEFVIPCDSYNALKRDIADLTSGKGLIKKTKSGYYPYSMKRGEI